MYIHVYIYIYICIERERERECDFVLCYFRSLDSSVGVVTGYVLDGQGLIPGKRKHNFQPGSGAHQASHVMGTEGSFPDVKETDLHLV
jgi:hypothetical protein